MLPLHQQVIGYKIHYSKLLEVLNSQRKLAYHLALLSRMVYGYKNAHRSQKYYQAVKSVNSHMRRFTNMNLKTLLLQKIGQLKKHLKNDVISEEEMKNEIVETSNELIKAFHILTDARNQCMNSVVQSKQILAMGFFISLHSTLIAISSSIYCLVFPIQNAIKEWFTNCLSKEELKSKKFESIFDEDEMKEEEEIKNAIKGNDVMENQQKFDVGQVISRDMLRKSTQINQSPNIVKKRKHEHEIPHENRKLKKLKKKKKMKTKLMTSVEESNGSGNIQDNNDTITSTEISQHSSVEVDVETKHSVSEIMIDEEGCDTRIQETLIKSVSSTSLGKRKKNKKKIKALKKKNKLKKLLELK